MQNNDLGSVIEEERLPVFITFPEVKLIAEVNNNNNRISGVKLHSDEKNRTTFENLTNLLNKASSIKKTLQPDALYLCQEKNNINTIRNIDNIPFTNLYPNVSKDLKNQLSEVTVNQCITLETNNENATVLLENKPKVKDFCDIKALKENQILTTLKVNESDKLAVETNAGK